MAKNGDALAIMLGAGPAESADDESEVGYEEAFRDAAESAMLAVKEGDASSFAEHLKDAIEICVEHREGGNPGLSEEDDY
tara:strand:+ start:215 stop:454 length:240 start_codon:yes stop_codon:yes gene_type:complete